MATQWVDQGARRLHLVDLNGAVAGKPRNRAAIEAIARWRYRPAKYNGQPVEVPVRTRIRFELPNN